VRAELTRRGVLAATAAAAPLLAAGCKGVGALGTPPRPGPAVAVLHQAISGERVLIARYRAALSASPALARTLTPVLGQHEAHLAALRARLIVPPRDARPAGGEPTAPHPARSPAAVLAGLETAEDTAARALVQRLSVVGPGLAQLLASIAASEASHAQLLRTERGTG
jgi:Ferritin-like domain